MLKAIDEVAAALQTHLIEEHEADPERAATQSSSTNSLKLLRQARERLGQGLRAIEADNIAETDQISLRHRSRAVHRRYCTSAEVPPKPLRPPALFRHAESEHLLRHNARADRVFTVQPLPERRSLCRQVVIRQVVI